MTHYPLDIPVSISQATHYYDDDDTLPSPLTQQRQAQQTPIDYEQMSAFDRLDCGEVANAEEAMRVLLKFCDECIVELRNEQAQILAEHQQNSPLPDDHPASYMLRQLQGIIDDNLKLRRLSRKTRAIWLAVRPLVDSDEEADEATADTLELMREETGMLQEYGIWLEEVAAAITDYDYSALVE